MKVLRSAQAALLEMALGEDASHCFPKGAGADPGLGCAFWPGQPSWQAGMTQELHCVQQQLQLCACCSPSTSLSSRLVVSTASSSPQPDHSLAMCPPPEQSLNVPLLMALLCSCLGQMALKQLIFKRGFYCQISKLFTSRRQSAAFPRAAAAAIQMDIHTCLLANSLPSRHRHVTWWHSPKHRLTPQHSMPRGVSGTKNQP